ncbi:MAG: lysoplasmalogenase [Anaerolineaceae bacterium]
MNHTTAILFWTIIGVLTLLNWIGAAQKNWKLYFATKPFVLAALILYFGLNGGLRADRLPFMVGLVFSLLGDIFLIPHSYRWFMAGLVAFFCTHLSYLIGFSQQPASPAPTILCSIAAVALIGFLCWYILRKTQGKPELKSMRKVYLPYSVVLVLMAETAILCWFRPGWSKPAAALVGLGSIGFLTSDILHACERMGKRIPMAKFWIILTYHLAQFMIVTGILLKG